MHSLVSLLFLVNVIVNAIMACMLEARIVEPVETGVARERLCKHARC
jgi:hypothetical protein